MGSESTGEPDHRSTFIATTPEGAQVAMYSDRLIFIHPEHPPRVITLAELSERKPNTIAEWLAIGQTLEVGATGEYKS